MKEYEHGVHTSYGSESGLPSIHIIKGSFVEKLRVTDFHIPSSPEIIKSSWHVPYEILKSSGHVPQEIFKSSWHVPLEILKSSWHVFNQAIVFSMC